MASDVTVVIGGGAAGICAAISAGRRGGAVVICEQNLQLGKKILATGNGRCNLLNDDFTEEHFNNDAKPLVRSVLEIWQKHDILGFFEGIGLKTYSQSGRIFPVTNQAASVLKVLELELQRLSVRVEYGFKCSGIHHSGDSLAVVSADGKRVEGRRVVLTGGGRSYPALGSDGNTHKLAAGLGHNIVGPVPSGVPLVVKSSLCHLLQGQRIQAKAKSVIGVQESVEVSGELLFTKYGLSGTCVLDLSGPISIAINREGRRDVGLAIDLVPFMSERELGAEIDQRRRMGTRPEDMLAGVLPNKFGLPLKSEFESLDAKEIANRLKNMRFSVTATRGWNEAEFTAGGVNTQEVQEGSLESKARKGVYLAGEVLDVDGGRGGFNLGWAWASGWVAGMGR